MTTSPPGASGSEPAQLTAALAAALRATIFASGLRIAPRRVGEIAAASAASYHGFLSGALDAAAVEVAGQQLAVDGLGHASLLTMVETLLGCGLAATPAGQRRAPVTYTTTLLAGYMATREALLLQEQERTRIALERARTHTT